MKYRIVDSKDPWLWDDETLYDTEEAAEVALIEAQEWARQEARREPSWADARLRIEECA